MGLYNLFFFSENETDFTEIFLGVRLSLGCYKLKLFFTSQDNPFLPHNDLISENGLWVLLGMLLYINYYKYLAD